jgi:hypothetical protein
MSHRNGDPGREARIRTSVPYLPCVEQSTTNRLEYLSNSINHDLGLIELDPVTAVWNNDDLAVRGKARHRLLLHRLGCGGIASRQNDQRHVTVSAARSNLGGTLRKASISLAKASKNFGCTQIAFSIGQSSDGSFFTGARMCSAVWFRAPPLTRETEKRAIPNAPELTKNAMRRAIPRRARISARRESRAPVSSRFLCSSVICNH